VFKVHLDTWPVRCTTLLQEQIESQDGFRHRLMVQLISFPILNDRWIRECLQDKPSSEVHYDKILTLVSNRQ
jgi:hypothetical protein